MKHLGDHELRRADSPGEGEGTGGYGEGVRSLRESQASVVSSSPARSATAFECFVIETVKRISQMLFTLYSERPTTSATMRQPDTYVPRGFTSTLSSSLSEKHGW